MHQVRAVPHRRSASDQHRGAAVGAAAEGEGGGAEGGAGVDGDGGVEAEDWMYVGFLLVLRFFFFFFRGVGGRGGPSLRTQER